MASSAPDHLRTPGLISNRPCYEGINIDLTAISEQTIEAQHVLDVHLGETLVPYATLTPLQAVLPFKRSARDLPADSEGVGGVNLN